MTAPISRSAMSSRATRAAKSFSPVDPRDPKVFARVRRNVSAVAKDAPKETVEQGTTWYPRAHDIAATVGRANLGDTRRGAGIVAALSPSMSWDNNIGAAHQLAGLHPAHVEQMAHANEAQKSYAQLIAGHERAAAKKQGVEGSNAKVKGAAPAHLYELHEMARQEHMGTRSMLKGTPLDKQSTDNIVKAHRIRMGEAPESVLPMTAKTGHFFRNVVDPSDKEPVTVDTHAHDLGFGTKLPFKTERGLSSVGRYNAFAGAYQQASSRLGHETAGTTQAITWSHWRNLYGRADDSGANVDQWKGWKPAEGPRNEGGKARDAEEMAMEYQSRATRRRNRQPRELSYEINRDQW